MPILILNGSPSGRKGNSQVLIKNLSAQLKNEPKQKGASRFTILHLSDIEWTSASKKKIFAQIKNATGFIFVTGTYWDSWGSPMQIFLENVTDLEGGPEFLGKPAAVFVLNHSVGGKGVLSRLQGVLSTLGCLIPPMSGMVYSWVNDQILKQKKASKTQKDLWCLADTSKILMNFQKSIQLNIQWESWPVDRKDYSKLWL